MPVANKTFSLIIPVYFNAGSLPDLFVEIKKMEAQLKRRSVNLELIFVDDGSQDGSLKQLLNFKKKRPATKVVKLTRNFGSLHCSKTGFRFVTGDAFAVAAADLQDPLPLFPVMVDRWKKGAKFVICERVSRDDPFFSKIFSWLFYFLLRTFVVPNYPKGGYDMALMDKVFLPHLLNGSKNTHTPLLAYWLGYQSEVVPFHRPARKYGKSRWTFVKKMNTFLDVMLGFSVTPIRSISLLGVGVSFLSAIYGVVVIINSILGNVPVRGYSTIVCLITFLLGLIIVMLWFIGEYLWRIFDDINRRPETDIEKVY